jgi:hypothetical protein
MIPPTNAASGLDVEAMKVVHPGLGCEAGVAKPTSPMPEPRMNIHKNARLTPQGRLLMVLRIKDEGWKVADAAAACIPLASDTAIALPTNETARSNGCAGSA